MTRPYLRRFCGEYSPIALAIVPSRPNCADRTIDAGHQHVRRIIVALALLSNVAFLAAQTSPAGAATPQGLANATLPAGVCSSGVSGVPKSGPIRLSHGEGTVGTSFEPDFFGAHLVGAQVRVNLAGADHRGMAASIVCNQGGSVAWDEMWVFDGTVKHPKVLFGGITPRSYDESANGNVGALISRIRVRGRSLVVQEEFPAAGDCVTCSTGRTTTTWGWSRSNPGHLVITEPAPKKVVVDIGAAPSGLGGSTATRNQAGSSLVAGRTVLATCVGEDVFEGTPWTELDTGAWVPSGDLQPIDLPNCDGTSGSTTTTSPTTAPSSTTEPVTNTSAAPCTAQAVAATVKAFSPGFQALEVYGCSGNYAYAGVSISTGPGPDDGDEITVLLMSENGSWQHIPNSICTGDTIPASIYQEACESN
jgi:hypothetical protein